MEEDKKKEKEVEFWDENGEDEEVKEEGVKTLSGKELDDPSDNTGLGSISAICILVVTKCNENASDDVALRREGCVCGSIKLDPSATAVPRSRVLVEYISIDTSGSALAMMLVVANGTEALSAILSLGRSGDIINSIVASVAVGSGNGSSSHVSTGRMLARDCADVDPSTCVAVLVALPSSLAVEGTRGKMER